jgi:phosphatidylethanolamine-binding protein (PEBP) family uncharacterized protein
MQVRFDDIDATSKIFLKQNTGNISFHWDYSPKKIYAIMMYDIDIPTSPTLIHFLEINIPGNAPGLELLSYIKPNPPDKVHRYLVDLFEQKNIIQPFNVTRKTDPKLIESMNSLKLIDQIMFKVKP